jgi:nitrile hydratase
MSYLSHADLGGRPTAERVQPEPEGELFHADWEPHALALTLAMGATGSWNIDMSRAARETLPDYSQSSYYRIWIAALEKLLVERRLALPDELAAGQALHPPVPVARVLRAADVATALAKGSPTERAAAVPLPAYAHGKKGVIEGVHGVHVFADRHAQGLGEQSQWLYRVAFNGTELWGSDAAPGSSVALDAWESYLEAASP